MKKDNIYWIIFIAVTIAFSILIVRDFTQWSNYKMPNIVDHISSYIVSIFFIYLFWRSRRKRGKEAKEVEGQLEKPDVKEELIKGVKKAWAVWSVMFSAFAIYMILSLLVSAKINAYIGTNVNFVRVVLYIISAVELVFLYCIRKIMLRGGSGGHTPMGEGHSSGLKPALIKYNRTLIVTFSIAVLIGVNGVILCLISRDFRSSFVFIIISLIAMLIYRPNVKEILELAVDVGNKRNEEQRE